MMSAVHTLANILQQLRTLYAKHPHRMAWRNLQSLLLLSGAYDTTWSPTQKIRGQNFQSSLRQQAAEAAAAPSDLGKTSKNTVSGITQPHSAVLCAPT
jgi:hypothetical protein